MTGGSTKGGARKRPVSVPGDLSALLAVVQEARSLFGVQAARSLWHVVGLPASAEMIEAGKGVVNRHPLSSSEVPSSIATFLETECFRDREQRVQSSILHQAYSAWAEANGAPCVSLTAFGRAMRRLGHPKVSSWKIFYIGFALRKPAISRTPAEGSCPLFEIRA